MRFGGYELIEKIGVGGMAEVYRARTVSPEGVERTLVIKKILPEYAANQSFIRMLVAEARVSSLLHHANIVQIFELGEIDGQYYIAMEYVPGPDLLAVLRGATHAKLRVPLELALFIVSEICNGLDYAHKATDNQQRPLNLIHRDISPSNIIISDQGAVKLMDFGVASADLTRTGRQRAVENTGSLKGKIGYMSPEQVTGQPVDHRADLFALGIVLFESLTLKRLFVGTSEAQTLANIRDAKLDDKLKRHPYIPPGVQAILHRALAKDPADRYPHAAAFREALLDYLFDQRLRVTNRKLARFLADLNWSEPTSAPKRPAAQPPTTDAVDSTPDTEPEIPPSDLETAHFSLKRVDGQPISPIDYQTLTSLMKRRAITADEPISVNDGPWTTVQEALSHQGLPTLLPHDADARPIRQGPNNRLTLPTLIHDLITSRADATLYVCDGARAKTLTVRRGSLIHADSTDRDERLGHFMLSRGLLDANQLAEAIIHSAERSMRLGDVLVADGTVEPHALAEALQAQRHARILELLSWEHGWYAVYEGVAPGDDLSLEAVDGLELLTQGLRTHWKLPALEQLFDELMDRAITLSEPDPATPRLPLTPQESRLLARLTEGQTVAHAIEDLDDEDRLAMLRVLFLQQRTGRISLGSTA